MYIIWPVLLYLPFSVSSLVNANQCWSVSWIEQHRVLKRVCFLSDRLRVLSSVASPPAWLSAALRCSAPICSPRAIWVGAVVQKEYPMGAPRPSPSPSAGCQLPWRLLMQHRRSVARSYTLGTNETDQYSEDSPFSTSHTGEFWRLYKRSSKKILLFFTFWCESDERAPLDDTLMAVMKCVCV